MEIVINDKVINLIIKNKSKWSYKSMVHILLYESLIHLFLKQWQHWEREASADTYGNTSPHTTINKTIFGDNY